MNVIYTVIQFLFWFSYGIIVNFNSVYLLKCGLTNTAIGLIGSIACALSIILQPALATYADRENSISIKSILLILNAGVTCIGGLLVLSYGKGSLQNGLLLVCAILIVQVALPFSNALATEMINAGKKINFSFARGIGSVGYAVMSVSVGKLAASYGAGIIPWMIIGSSLALMAAIFCFPFVRSRREMQTSQVRQTVRAFLGRYPSFSVVLAGCTLIYTSHVFINNFVYQIVTYKGGTSEHMGIVMGIAGVLEVSTMFLFSTLLKWKNSSFWFRICGIFFTLKCLGTLLAGSMGALYAVQILQPLGWGLMIVSSVYYVNEMMEEQDKIKGQAYMTMTLSAGTIIGSMTGGWLIDTVGIPGMLITSVVCGAVGTGIVMFKVK